MDEMSKYANDHKFSAGFIEEIGKVEVDSDGNIVVQTAELLKEIIEMRQQHIAGMEYSRWANSTQSWTSYNL